MRRFPPPWRAEAIPAGFRVVAACGTVVAYVYGEDRRWTNHATLTPDEARRIAANIARLPELLGPRREGVGEDEKAASNGPIDRS